MNKNKNSNNEKRSVEINGKYYKIPKLLLNDEFTKIPNKEIVEALRFNKNLIMENFIIPNRLKFPLSRNILEKYYN